MPLAISLLVPAPMPMDADMSEHGIDVQLALQDDAVPGLPDGAQIRGWVRAALLDYPSAVEVSVRVVDEQQIRDLNRCYRKQDKSTNVLSFPALLPADLPVEPRLIGDLVISAAVVSREAVEQDKPLCAHLAHMLVHGTLHLLGYDHQTDVQAAEMECRERHILAALGYPDPYREVLLPQHRGGGHD